MSVPIICSCGTLIGEREGLDAVVLGFMALKESQIFRPCPIIHPEPTITTKDKWFGLIREVTVEYPETLTQSGWEEYVGPDSKFWLRLAFIGSKHYPNGDPEGLLIYGKRVYWQLGRGFYGSDLPVFLSK